MKALKALEIRASFSITRLKLQSRGERRTRSCSWRDQLYLSAIVWKLKATRDLFLVQLICIVCTRKCKEFNHKRTVRTQRSRFKFVQSPFTADFQRRKMQKLDWNRRNYGQNVTVLHRRQTFRIDRYVTKKSEIGNAEWEKNGFPLLSQNPVCVDGYIPLLKEDIY